MPTRSRTVGDQTTYDELGEFDEERKDQEPGYSTNKSSCRDTLFMIVLVFSLTPFIVIGLEYLL